MFTAATSGVDSKSFVRKILGLGDEDQDKEDPD